MGYQRIILFAAYRVNDRHKGDNEGGLVGRCASDPITQFVPRRRGGNRHRRATSSLPWYTIRGLARVRDRQIVRRSGVCNTNRYPRQTRSPFLCFCARRRSRRYRTGARRRRTLLNVESGRRGMRRPWQRHNRHPMSGISHRRT